VIGQKASTGGIGSVDADGMRLVPVTGAPTPAASEQPAKGRERGPATGPVVIKVGS
jgi:hypothetical protein